MDFESLPNDLKEKARACTTPEDFLALARDEGVELSEEALEGITGGSGGWSTCPTDGCSDVCVAKNCGTYLV